MKTICLLLSFFLASLWVNGQQAQLVDDFNKGMNPAGSFPRQFTLVGSHIYFYASDQIDAGRELWRTDGTTAGTRLVMELRSGTTGSDPDNLEAFDGQLYFHADDGESGDQLWRTDGTLMGTEVVNEIDPKRELDPMLMTKFGNLLLFTGTDLQHGREFWKSDGTAAGTQLVKDIHIGASSSTPTDYFVINDKVFFIADDGTTGEELWVTDGTESGTLLLKDIYPGSSDSRVDEMTAFNGELFFEANNGTHGYELWKSDGTPSGTVMVKDIYPGSSYSSPRDLTSFQGMLYFAARDASNGTELWKSDGTSQGTVLVKDINPGTADGSPSGITNIADQYLLLGADDGITGKEIWKSDGSANGTNLFIDLNSGSGSSQPDDFTFLTNGIIVFDADDGAQLGIWVMDGSSANASLLKEGVFIDGVESVVLDEKLIFKANDNVSGSEPWITDGTPGGTKLLKNIAPDIVSGYPQKLHDIDGELFFGVFDSLGGGRGGVSRLKGNGDIEFFLELSTTNALGYLFYEMTELNGQALIAGLTDQFPERTLYLSDGTSSGTNMVDPGVEDPYDLKQGNGNIYFGDLWLNLWQTDGTETGTDTIASAITDKYSYHWALDHLFINGTKGGVEGAIWKFNPANQEVTLVKDINTNGPDNLGFFREWKGELYFTATEQDLDFKLWKTDGTEQGTVAISDTLNMGFGDGQFTELNGVLYFSGNDFKRGMELWKTDGTPAGTQLVRDINAGPEGSDIRFMTRIGDKIVFSNYTESAGRELWVTDGTEGGTRLVHDIAPGQVSSIPNFPNSFVALNGKAYFTANDGQTGTELWMTDGTEGGTLLAADVNPGYYGSTPVELTVSDGKLYFSAFHPDYGRELWAVDYSVGMEEPKPHLTLQIYPNPTFGPLRLEGITENEILITDLHGRIVKSLNTNASTLDINVKDFASGIYFIHTGNKVAKFLKQ